VPVSFSDHHRWQLKDVKFPPKRSLVLNKLNVAFIESRRAALENWWQALLALDRIAEFNKHYASQPLKVGQSNTSFTCSDVPARDINACFMNEPFFSFGFN